MGAVDKWGAQYIGSRVSPGCYFYYSLLLDGLCVWLKFTNVSLKFISLSEVKKNILYFSATVGMLFHCMSLYQLGIKNKDYMVYQFHIIVKGEKTSHLFQLLLVCYSTTVPIQSIRQSRVTPIFFWPQIYLFSQFVWFFEIFWKCKKVMRLMNWLNWYSISTWLKK